MPVDPFKKRETSWKKTLGILIALAIISVLIITNPLKQLTPELTGAIIIQENRTEQQTCNETYQVLNEQFLKCRERLNEQTIDNNACQAINQKNSGTIINLKINLSECEQELAEKNSQVNDKTSRINGLEKQVSAYQNLSQTNLLNNTYTISLEISKQGLCTKPENEYDYQKINSCIEAVMDADQTWKVMQNIEILSNNIDSILTLIR